MYNIFQVVEIIVLRSEGLRGQAWVIFDSVANATAALQAEQGFTFFGKDLKISYAHEKSDRIAKMDGTFVPREKRAKRDLAPVAEKSGKIPKVTTHSQEAMDILKSDVPVSSTPSSTTAAESVSNILFAESLPKDCNEMMLAMLFRQYHGYREVRMPRPGLAFIEFDEEPHATVAFKALRGFKLTATDTLDLKYGRV